MAEAYEFTDSGLKCHYVSSGNILMVFTRLPITPCSDRHALRWCWRCLHRTSSPSSVPAPWCQTGGGGGGENAVKTEGENKDEGIKETGCLRGTERSG